MTNVVDFKGNPTNPPAPPGGTPPTRGVDYDTFLPVTDHKGMPRACIANFREILLRTSIAIKYNVITKQTEITIPNRSFSTDNATNASYAELFSECALFKFPTDTIRTFIPHIADENPYNPVAEWIESIPWDGTARKQQFYDTIKTTNDITMKEFILKRWMYSCIAAAFNHEGVSSKGVLVLQGEQNLGKTSWFKRLVPPEKRFVKDGLILRIDDKDSVIRCISHWIVELGELDATFRKSDIAQLKAFIPQDRDKIRRPYAHGDSDYARRTIFFASVNHHQFLHDTTGNTRFWCLECTQIDYTHDLDMQQVWAEFLHDFRKETPGCWHLTSAESEIVNVSNKTYEMTDPIEEKIQAAYDWEGSETRRWATATVIAAEIGLDKANRSDVTRVGQVVLKLNGGAKDRHGRKGLLLPPLNTGIREVLWERNYETSFDEGMP